MENSPMVYDAYNWDFVHSNGIQYAIPVLQEVCLLAQITTHPRASPRDASVKTSKITAADGLLLTTSSGDQYRLVGDPGGWGAFMETSGCEWDRAAPFKWRRLNWWQRLKKRWRQRLKNWRFWT